MANHKTALLAFEASLSEQIEKIVIGTHYKDRWSFSKDNTNNVRLPEHQRNVLLSREEGLEILDEEYDSGYGGADCFPFYAWSANHFFTVSEYDGSTHVSAWPRHPVNIAPEMD